MRIAIVGGGIAGLTAAYLLCRKHEIALFESNDYVGGHTNTIEIEEARQTLAIDTGFIVFNRRTYPNFVKLLAELGVESQESEMSFGVRCDRTGLEYNGNGLNGLFAQRRNLMNPWFLRLLRDFIRFSRQSPLVLAELDEAGVADAGLDESATVGQFLSKHRYSRQFAEQYFLPLGSAIWSCPRTVFGDFPLRFVLEFYRNHGLLGLTNRPTWRVIRGGSRRYVERLICPFESSIRTKTPVGSVVRHPTHVEVRAAGEPAQRFDRVVFACHADQALRILGENATAVEREVLSSFPYSRNIAVLHTDTSVLPNSRRAWASWNYRLAANPAAPATLTYNMNRLQRLPSETTYCVTLNDEARIDPRRVLRRIEYEHPVFTCQRAAAQRRHSEVLAAHRTSFCGAYWGNGFHEDGVVSALAVWSALENQPCKAAFTREESNIAENHPSSMDLVSP